MSFEVLFVCTGNICRSPIAERLLAARLTTDEPITVASAGTRAMVGYGMDEPAAHVLRRLGGEPDGHIARQLAAELVTSADLVLTATTVQRDVVIRSDPGAMRRTFTMREFVRLATGVPPTDAQDLRQRVLAVAGGRGMQPPPRPGADEIGDPYGAPLAVMQRCGEQIAELIDAVRRILAGASA